jgi:hypothetical protein
MLFLLGVLFYGLIKIAKWTLIEKVRIKWATSILVVLLLSFVINKMFFTNMEFIQSKVYYNLYIVKNPVKDNEIIKKAIVEKIKSHLKTEHKIGQKLEYTKGNDFIYFYEYVGASFSFLSEAGTEYFIDHEEDLGGFVSEELGMYQEYRMAEFYYKPCTKDTTLICGELDLFHEGEFVKTDTLINLNK